MYKRSPETKRLTAQITRRSFNYYKQNKAMCVKHNFYKRCEVFIKYKKKVWPPLRPHEIRIFISATKLPAKYLKNINGYKKT